MAFGDTPPAGTPAPEAAPAAAEPNPWESWGQVWQDPTAVNPHEVHQHYQWVQDLRSDDMHGPTLERALRDWGYLQDGEGLADFQQALEAHRQQSADPFASFRAPQQDLQGFAPPDYDEGELQLDPHSLREVWTQDMQRQREELMSEFENRQASARLELELERQLDRVVAEKGLDADDRQDLWGQVQYRIQTGQVNPQGLQSLVADTYGAMEARVNKILNARLAANGGGTEPPPPVPGTGGAGAAPTGKAPIRSIKDLARATMDRMGDD